jgi:hypothetical protein
MINVFADFVICLQTSVPLGGQGARDICNKNFSDQIFLYAMYFVALAGATFIAASIQVRSPPS